MYQFIVTGIHLLICSYTDFRWKRIYWLWIVSYGCFILFGYFAGQHPSLEGIITGTIIGGFFVLFSFVSSEKMGYGDGIILLLLGFSLGGDRLFWIMMTAFFWTGTTGILLYIGKKTNLKGEISYVPFLLLGYLVQLVGGLK